MTDDNKAKDCSFHTVRFFLDTVQKSIHPLSDTDSSFHTEFLHKMDKYDVNSYLIELAHTLKFYKLPYKITISQGESRFSDNLSVTLLEKSEDILDFLAKINAK